MNNEKIEACIYLSSYLDTLGFNNGTWEFKYNKTAYDILGALFLMENLVYQYFALGGTKINMSTWNASDDTLLLLATTNAINNGGGEENYIKEYLKILPRLEEDKRAAGFQTLKSLKHLKQIIQKKQKTYMNDIPIETSMGGNGAAIRTASIGLKWFNNIDKIIEESIIASRLTHNLPIGFLGGLVSALFTSYAFNNIKPWLWLDKLLELHESNKIKDYIYTTNLKNKYDKEIDNYFYYWYKYKEDRFSNIIVTRNKSEFLIPEESINKLVEYIPNFKKLNKKNEISYNKLGLSGIDSVIYSYDALLLSIIPNNNLEIDLNKVEYNWESIIFFGCLHIGDTDSTGAILGAWYGALNGFKGIDKNKMKELEFFNEINEIVKKLQKN